MRATLKLTLSALVAICQIWSTTVQAQSLGNALPDAEPPTIELEEISSSEAARNQVFTAQVVDDRELVDVTLYHRRSGQSAFEPETMLTLGSTSYFSATVTTNPEDLRAIEYYVQARDEGGNRTVFGYAFDPLIRSLTPASVAAPLTLEDDDRDTAAVVPAATARGGEALGTESTVKWWHIALGVVAVGALAAAAGGGSDGGSGGGENTVPLTITLGEPR